MITRFKRPFLITSILVLILGVLTAPADGATGRGTKSLAEDYNLPVPKRLTSFQHPVIYASPDVYTKRVGGKTIVRQTLIIKWGLHVFEVAEGIYQCTGTTLAGFTCEWVDHTRLGTYSICDVTDVVSGAKPKCSGQISGNSGPTGDIDAGWDPELERGTSNEWTEFPERSHDPDYPVP